MKAAVLFLSLAMASSVNAHRLVGQASQQTPSGSSAKAALDAAAMGGAIASPKSFDALYSGLAIGAKGEFETTEAFTRRAAAAADTGIIAIEIDLTSGVAGAGISYNADSGAFVVRVGYNHTRGAQLASRVGAVVVRERDTDQGVREAVNGFGAKFSVRDIVADMALIAVVSGPQFFWNASKMTIPASPDSARVIKPFLRAYIVGRLTPSPAGGFASADSDVSTATISIPLSLQYKKRVLWMDAAVVFVVDSRTGRVVTFRAVQCEKGSTLAC